MLLSNALAAQTTTDNALWSGGLFLVENDDGLDYSAEYQLRLDDHMSSFSNHFVELMGYSKRTTSLILNGGYRFTQRTDHVESRVYFGGFWDMTRSTESLWDLPDRLKVVLQIGYQHDFNARFDERFMGSNSVRWILVASKPGTDKVRPFLLAGVLTTWNDAYNFGIDKIRLGGGVIFNMTERSRLRCQYIREAARFVTPKKHTNIIWLRYETSLGK
jgi:hypothetical protein